jgi:hypothetical protein
MREFIDSRSELNKSWLLSFASRKEGEDMDENSCNNFEHVVMLMPSKYAETLLMTASKAG